MTGPVDAARHLSFTTTSEFRLRAVGNNRTVAFVLGSTLCNFHLHPNDSSESSLEEKNIRGSGTSVITDLVSEVIGLSHQHLKRKIYGLWNILHYLLFATSIHLTCFVPGRILALCPFMVPLFCFFSLPVESIIALSPWMMMLMHHNNVIYPCSAG